MQDHAPDIVDFKHMNTRFPGVVALNYVSRYDSTGLVQSVIGE